MESSYLQKVCLYNLQLVIVGKDPYPTDSTAIPFCKKTWKEQLSKTCSGRYVLLSIGVDLHAAERSYDSPQKLFEALRNRGIVFLNASHDYIGGSIGRVKHKGCLERAHLINRPFLVASKQVVYCGEAWKIEWVEKIGTPLRAIHPDIRNRNKLATRKLWKLYWADRALLHKCRLTLKEVNMVLNYKIMKRLLVGAMAQEFRKTPGKTGAMAQEFRKTPGKTVESEVIKMLADPDLVFDFMTPEMWRNNISPVIRKV